MALHQEAPQDRCLFRNDSLIMLTEMAANNSAAFAGSADESGSLESSFIAPWTGTSNRLQSLLHSLSLRPSLHGSHRLKAQLALLQAPATQPLLSELPDCSDDHVAHIPQSWFTQILPSFQDGLCKLPRVSLVRPTKQSHPRSQRFSERGTLC